MKGLKVLLFIYHHQSHCIAGLLFALIIYVIGYDIMVQFSTMRLQYMCAIHTHVVPYVNLRSFEGFLYTPRCACETGHRYLHPARNSVVVWDDLRVMSQYSVGRVQNTHR